MAGAPSVAVMILALYLQWTSLANRQTETRSRLYTSFLFNIPKAISCFQMWRYKLQLGDACRSSSQSSHGFVSNKSWEEKPLMSYPRNEHRKRKTALNVPCSVPNPKLGVYLLM